MSDLKNSIITALKNHKIDELNAYIKGGIVFISHQEKLLLKSGIDEVNPNGKEAIKTLANGLNNTRNIAVVFDGRTDRIAIQTAQLKDNRALSTAIATSLVRKLTIDLGFDSNLISASGKSQFHPIMTNNTTEGRSGNCRTEVILSSNLKDGCKLLYL